MYIMWDDKKGYGRIDNHKLNEKPEFSFDYSYISVYDFEQVVVKNNRVIALEEDEYDEVKEYYSRQKIMLAVNIENTEN